MTEPYLEYAGFSEPVDLTQSELSAELQQNTLVTSPGDQLRESVHGRIRSLNEIPESGILDGRTQGRVYLKYDDVLNYFYQE